MSKPRDDSEKWVEVPDTRELVGKCRQCGLRGDTAIYLVMMAKEPETDAEHFQNQGRLIRETRFVWYRFIKRTM